MELLREVHVCWMRSRQSWHAGATGSERGNGVYGTALASFRRSRGVGTHVRGRVIRPATRFPCRAPSGRSP
ncbi:hypothetical protein GCM10010145_19820 [Streptomyces ruber]|uniref:Uncharacterized protein n=2 Tax=Streptomyces TaxID=1883 RepID=A0A918BBV4_9ACTN|nr:hypothetical protein GCM10010145_19820 [Streptomyces ruber]